MNIALGQATRTFAAEQTERPFSPPLSRTHPPGLYTLRVGALRPPTCAYSPATNNCCAFGTGDG